ncbi:MAG TPA: class I SAM-dependent methyltransferase [Polyangiaceae bacterium]|nr:class I SAM-dependent methyltransferase [Polyangiaceae bacterium]
MSTEPTSSKPPQGVPVRIAYEAWAAGYDDDENVTRDLDAEVLRSAGLPLRGASVVEIGAGTGKNTAFLAEQASEVIALDLTPPMLERARQRCPAPHVRFIEHDIREPWPVSTGRANVVVGNLVLEHIENLTPIFSEAARVLSPQGSLYLCELHPYRQLRGTTARFQNDGESVRVEAYLHMTADYVMAARAAGFELVSMAEPNELGSPELALPRLLQLTWVKAQRADTTEPSPGDSRLHR